MVGSRVVPVYLSARPTEPSNQSCVLHVGRKFVPTASPSVQNIAAGLIYNLRACMERMAVELSGSASASITTLDLSSSEPAHLSARAGTLPQETSRRSFRLPSSFPSVKCVCTHPLDRYISTARAADISCTPGLHLSRGVFVDDDVMQDPPRP